MQKNKRRPLAAIATVAGIAFFLGAAPAHALFVKDPDPGGEKLFIDGANKSDDSFSGSVGSNNSSQKVDITTIGLVDTGNGYANIKPIKDGFLTSLTFTPRTTNDVSFSDFSFRGQLADEGVVTLTVQDNQLHAPQVFQFDNLGTNSDFKRIGIVSLPGSDFETIQSVTIQGPFKEVKQIDFSVGSVIPEPATYAMLGLGVALLGVAVRRRKMM
jgi:hypothetical protein